jgi:hypothetical protein
MRDLALRLVLAALVVGVVVGPAHGSELHDHGWWWRAQTGVLVDLPPPPYVPEDGLVVGNGPDGPTAIAAVRYRLSEDETEPTLVLRVHDERGAEPSIVACPIAEVWFGDRAGRWEDVPAHDCEATAVVGTPDEDGETWAFALNTLVRGSAIDVVLRVPEGTATMFEVVFEAPDDDALQTREGDDDFEVPPVTAPPGEGGPDPSESPAAQPWTTEPPPAVTFGPGPDESDAGGDDAAPPPVVADEPPGGPTDTAPPATTDSAPPDATAAATEAAGLNDRLLAALLLAVGLLVAADLAWQRAPAPRRLGAGGRTPVGAAEGAHRGLGRFRRPREGQPTPLV